MKISSKIQYQALLGKSARKKPQTRLTMKLKPPWISMTDWRKVIDWCWFQNQNRKLDMSFLCPKKEIVYRGGVVRFFIPKHWNEEYEPDGGGTFYESGNDTGTLRLNVLSFLMKEDTSPEQLLTMVQKRKVENQGEVESLPDGRFLLKYSARSKEDGENLFIFRWEIAKMVSPRDFNIAAFTFTIGETQLESKAVLEEISSIEEEVKKVAFGMHGESYEP
jgi:hypothetical protein